MADQEKQPQKKQEATPSANTIKEVHVAKSSTAIAITVAVLIATALIGFGYAIYNEEPEAQTEAQVEEQPQEETTDVTSPISGDDVDSAIDEIESEINSLDEDDFSESELSDQELGL